MTVHIGKRFELASSAAVITSIVIMALETFSLPEAGLELLFAADIALSLLFLLEYLFRLATAENKRRYATSFYGVIDLIAIFPIVFHAAASVRVLRLLRLLRILRLLKLQRYSDALDRYIQALKLVAAEAAIFTGVALVFIVSFSFLIYEVEHARQPDKYGNIFDAIWWAAISLTSVGYGDLYPITTEGRLLTLLMVLTGMGIVAVPTALLASALSRVRQPSDSPA